MRKRFRVSLFTLLSIAIVGGLTVAAGIAFAATTVVMDGSTTVGPIAKAFAEYYMKAHPDVNITVSESGSGNGAEGILNGTCNIANMSRDMKDEERKACEAKGVKPVRHTIALDGVAVIIHPANPVKGLTTQQVADIYTGKITNWNQVGGPNVRIVAISRDTNSGTYEVFEEKALSKAKMGSAVEYVGSNGAIRQRVQGTQVAIGYVGLGFVDNTVKALTVNGVMPSAETIRSGKYPLARELYMFTNGNPVPGGHVHALVTLHTTKKGREIIAGLGFVPLSEK